MCQCYVFNNMLISLYSICPVLACVQQVFGFIIHYLSSSIGFYRFVFGKKSRQVTLLSYLFASRECFAKIPHGGAFKDTAA